LLKFIDYQYYKFVRKNVFKKDLMLDPR